MTTTSTTRRKYSVSHRKGARSARRIVIATDGAQDSDNAFEVARAYARSGSAEVHVASVCEPTPASLDWSPLGSAVMPVNEVADPRIAMDVRQGAVGAQLERAVGHGVKWPVTIVSGPVASSIESMARETAADLIIVGRGRHGLSDRFLGREHLVKLLRESSVPVLAAEESLTTVPKRMICALDMSEYSVEIARVAFSWLAATGTMHLVHVIDDAPLDVPDQTQWALSYESGIRDGLEGVRSKLHVAPGSTVETAVLRGHPETALIEFANTIKADVLVVGAAGHGFLSRLVVGSVTTHLLREAPCSILAVPVGAQAL